MNKEKILFCLKVFLVFLLSVLFFGMEAISFKIWIIGIFLSVLLLASIYFVNNKKTQKKEVRLLATDGICNGPWDNATPNSEANWFRVETRTIRAKISAKNLNEAVGIFLINNPGTSFKEIILKEEK